MTASATTIRGAVAFVTSTGVARLLKLLEANPELRLTLTARGAPITDPRALIALADAGATVRVVCGADALRFHPKLWIAHAADGCHVLSGSGNATAGGLSGNYEQFEYLFIQARATECIDSHVGRLVGFEQLGSPLAQMRDTPYWAEWLRQAKRREALEAEARELDERLVVRGTSAALDGQLYADLHALYVRAKEEVRIPDGRGGDRPYVASRFKQALERAREEGGLVPLVARMVKSPTDGLHHLADAQRTDLMVETIVLDASKPYHHRFDDSTKSNARANLQLVAPPG